MDLLLQHLRIRHRPEIKWNRRDGRVFAQHGEAVMSDEKIYKSDDIQRVVTEKACIRLLELLCAHHPERAPSRFDTVSRDSRPQKFDANP